MKVVRCGLIAAVAALMVSAAPALAQDCETGVDNMSQVYDCLYDYHQQRLDTEFKATFAAVKARDKDAAALLTKAEDSWAKFASDSCDYTAATSYDEIPEAARVNCYATFVDARIRILQAYRRKISGG